jgi:putative tricarboxylic transport membrane protein
MLPLDKMGDDPYVHIYFPLTVSAVMFVLSVIYVIRELKVLSVENPHIKAFLSKRSVVLVGATLGLGILYTLTLDVLGYLIATFVFLTLLLLVVNGKRKWLVNLLVALIFTLLTYYLLKGALSLSLPNGTLLESLGIYL